MTQIFAVLKTRGRMDDDRAWISLTVMQSAQIGAICGPSFSTARSADDADVRRFKNTGSYR
jgi:hypothetical protein